MNSFPTYRHCLICSSENIKPLVGYESAFLNSCKNCGFVFCNRIPSDKELSKHYKNYGTNFFCSEITKNRYNEILDQMEKYRKNNRIMDIGCGAGYFLDEAQKRGWEVYGTEYSERLINLLSEKNITIHAGALNTSNYQDDYFDVITSFEVIEHINTPASEVNKIHQLLRKGGLIYLTTPNFNSLLRLRLKSKYNVIQYPEHLSYFTPKTLRKLFDSNGFKTIKIETTGISFTRLKTSQGKSTQKILSGTSDDEKIRHAIEENKTLKIVKRLANNFLTIIGRGDSLKGWFIKK